MAYVVTEDRSDGVRIITLNDPDRRNALSHGLRRELAEAVQDIIGCRHLRAVVVSGNGTAFCAGAHLEEVFGYSDRPVDKIREELHEVYNCFLNLRQVAVPTIAAIQGPAVGAGLNMALACDLQIFGPHGSLAASFSKIGLHPGGGCTYFLVQALGRQLALHLLLEGGTIDAQQAVEYGVGVGVVENPLEEAVALADRIASLDVRLIQDIKAAVDLAENAGFQATLEFESWAQASSATKSTIRSVIKGFRRKLPRIK